MKKNLLLPYLAFSFLVCACTQDSIESFCENREIKVEVSLPGWNGSETRAGEVITPINVFYVPQGSDVIGKLHSNSDGSSLSITLPEGTYDVYAVCGLPANMIPHLRTEEITVPDNANISASPGGKTCFAVGRTSVKIANKTSVPSSIEIKARRELAWLDINITDVPVNVKEADLFVRGQKTAYTLKNHWTLEEGQENEYTALPLTQKSSSSTTWACSRIVPPCESSNGLYVMLRTKDENDQYYFRAATINVELSEGVHLASTLTFSSMVVVEGDLELLDWSEENEDASFDEIIVGAQYQNFPATVLHTTPNQIGLFPHKPMSVTLDELKAMDFGNIDYTEIPNLILTKWFFPENVDIARSLLTLIDSDGFDAFNRVLSSTGNAPISEEADNILAYRDKTTQRFYRYDFQNNSFAPVSEGSQKSYLLYPFGIIKLN